MRKATILCAMLLAMLQAMAVNPAQVRWNDENADTLRVNNMLTEAIATVKPGKAQDYVITFARMLEGTPYVEATLENPGGEELLTVNLNGLDCTTFVENVMALSLTAAKGRPSWRDFLTSLESIRYRGGHLNGYPSRLHYICDWVVDNSSRGNIIDATTRMPATDYVVKTIDFMGTHRGSYAALADDDTFKAIKKVEEGYRSHRFPYIKKSSLINDAKVMASLRDGDIIAFTTDIAGLDVSHMGIVTVDSDGVRRLLHASSKRGEVTVDPLTLADYLKRSKHVTGLRVIRLAD